MKKMAKLLFDVNGKDISIKNLSKEEKEKIVKFLKDDNLCKISDDNYYTCPPWLLITDKRIKEPLKIRNYKIKDEVYFWMNYQIFYFENNLLPLSYEMIKEIMKEYESGYHPKK